MCCVLRYVALLCVGWHVPYVGLPKHDFEVRCSPIEHLFKHIIHKHNVWICPMQTHNEAVLWCAA